MHNTGNFTFNQFRPNNIQVKSHDYIDVLDSHLNAFINAYTANIIEDDFRKTSSIVGWTCFMCRKKIEINVNPLLKGTKFNLKKMYCGKHRPSKMMSTYKNDSTFIRNLVSFQGHIKQTITKNSKLESLSLWKELHI